MLQLCISQEMNNKPFNFKGTGIRVYSLEEALFHVYHYWRESIDDLFSDRFGSWMKDIGLLPLAEKINGIKDLSSMGGRVIAFLKIIQYFNNTELMALKADLDSWEHRVEWEKLKDRGDRLVARGEARKAISLYNHALKYDQSPKLLNNMAIAYMQLCNYHVAVSLLSQAYASSPDLAYHYVEALTLNGEHSHAEEILQQLPVSPESVFLRGLIAYNQDNYPQALELFLQAHSATPNYEYANKIADTYVKLGQHDMAISVLSPEDEAYHIKMAEIYADYGHAHMPKAIAHITKAISIKSDPIRWIKLASLYRQNYDYDRASQAIENAMHSGSEEALLENIRIKKAQGRRRQYKSDLSKLITKLKNQYRESYSE